MSRHPFSPKYLQTLTGHQRTIFLSIYFLAFLAIGLGSACLPAATAYTFTTFAGLPGSPGSSNGTGSTAGFNGPLGVATDSSGNVYVSDLDNGIIRKISPLGVVTTLAGTPGVFGSSDGTGAAAQFSALCNQPIHEPEGELKRGNTPKIGVLQWKTKLRS